MSRHLERHSRPGAALGMRMDARADTELSPEILQGQGKDEVITGLQYKDGMYGSRSLSQWENGLLYQITVRPSVGVVFDGLPDSGKTTTLSQEASRLQRGITWLNTIAGTQRTLRYAGWSSFLLSKLGNDPTKFGSLTREQLIGYSEQFAEESERLLASPNVIALIEVPGAAERGNAVVDRLAASENAFKLTVWSDEDLRRQKKEFRRFLHLIDTPEQLAILLERFQIVPNAPINAELLETMQHTGATVRGIEAVDADTDDEMLQLMKAGSINIHSGFVESRDLSEDELRVSLGFPSMRTTAVGQYFDSLNRQRYKLPPERVFLGFNADAGPVNLRRDILDEISISFDNGRMKI